MHQLDKAASSRRWAVVRKIICDWDPIGVMDDPSWPRDEYDCFVSPVLRRLEHDSSVDELQSYFDTELGEHFGISSDTAETRQVAERLKQWFCDNRQETEPRTAKASGT